MAPGRRRGGKGAKNNSQLSLGDLVLAKVKGFPAWPAKISKPEDWDKTPDPKKHFVYFFGTQEIAFVAPADIQAFTNEAKNKLSARCRTKTVSHFAQAVKEICEAFEESQGKSSSAVNDEDDDRQDFGSDAHSADGIVDDGMGADGPNGETNYNSSGAQGPGLERCSHRLEEMEGQDMQRKEVSTSSPGRDFSSDKFISKEDCSGLDAKHQDDGKKMLVNGHKSKKTMTDSQRKSDGSFEKHKIRSPSAVTSLARGSSGGQLDLSVSGENHKDEAPRRIAVDRLNESSLDVKKSKSDASVKKIKKFSKDKMHNGGADNLQKDAEGSKEQDKVDLPGRKLKPELVKGKHNVVDDETVHPIKRSKCADDTAKGSQHSTRKSDVVVNKTANAELKRSTSRLRAEHQMVPRRQTSSLPGDEDDLPPSKRRRRAQEAMSDSTLVSEVTIVRSSMTLKTEPSSGNLKSPAAQLPTKRRAVRLCDEDEEEEPKTPVHGGSVRKVDAPSRISNHAKTTALRTENSTHDQSGGRNLGVLKADSLKESSSSAKVLGDSLSPNSQQGVQRPKKAMVEQVLRSPGNMKSEKIISKEIKPVLVSSKCEQNVERPKKAIAGHFHISPGNVDFEKISPKEVKQNLISPKRSPLLADASLSVIEPLKANKPSGRVGNVMQKKVQAGTGKGSGGTSDSLHHSQSQAPNERSKPVFSGERQKSTPVSSSWGTEASLVSGKPMDNNSSGERLEAGREDPASSLIDSKDADSAKSMKLLIAAAQAKRRQAHSQSFPHDYVTSVQNSVTDVSGGSPSSASAVHPILSGLSSMMQPDVQGYNPQTSYASPSSRLHHLASNTQPDSQEVEETIASSGHRPSVGSLSGGTEAAVARDAFEGMIETLSRTKDSIARATRLAIDCAKYGIANEVTLAGFRSGKFLTLVATNVAARGLDISDVQLIIQCEPPREVEAYIHRSGRTGRAGNTGVAVMLYEPRKSNISKLERESGVKFEHLSAPQPADIAKAAGREAAEAITQVSDSVIPVFSSAAEELLKSSGLSPVELLAKALAKTTGYAEIKTRSLLTSMENYVTVLLESERPIYSQSYVYGVLRRFVPEEKVESIMGLALTADQKGAIFDVSAEDLALFLTGQENAAGVSLTVVKELPQLQEREQQSRGRFGGGGYGGRGGGGSRFGGRGGRGGGDRFSRGSSGGGGRGRGTFKRW